MNKSKLYPFFISFILLITVIIINAKSFNKMKEFASHVDHTRDVISSFELLSSSLKSAQIYSPTYEKYAYHTFYQLYKENTNAIPTEVAHLKSLITDNPRQVKLLDSIEAIVNQQWATLQQKNIAEIIQSGEIWRLERLWRIQTFIDEGIKTEQVLLASRKTALESTTKETGLLTAIFSIIALSIIGITFISNLALIRKRTWLEGFLESILNTSQNGIVSYKAIRKQGKAVDFKIEFANAAITDLLGVKPENVIGKKLSELPSFVKEGPVFKKYIHVVDTGKKDQFETLYDVGDTKKWLYAMLAKQEDGLTASFHDISEIKQYEEDLKKNITQLERSNKELEEYAYVASHDLQEPLRKIITYSNLLNNIAENKLDEKGKTFVSKIMNSAERMSFLIKDILNFSGLRPDTIFEKTDLNKVLKDVLEDLELLITQKEAIIKTDDLPVLDAIPLQIHQLFYNLVNNALKFSKADIKPELTIQCKPLQANELSEYPALNQKLSYCKIIVSDNGIGFNQIFSDQIFGLFKRLNDKKQFAGSGIGLALCKKVVENHNGELIAEGKENEGASFYIIIPYEQERML